MAHICNVEDLGSIFAKVGFDRVTLSTVENVDPELINQGEISLDDLTTQVSINCYLREQVSADAASWYQRGDILNYLRLRVLVCVGDRNPAGLDFISQRFNEYQNLQGQFVVNAEPREVSPRQFIDLAVRPELRPKGQIVDGQQTILPNNEYLLMTREETRLYMPYQSADPTLFLRAAQATRPGFEAYVPSPLNMNPAGRVMRGRLSDIIVYDKTLADILPKRINPETQQYEVAGRSVRETIPANEITKTPMMVLFEQAPVLPIEFKLGPGTDIDYNLNNYMHTRTLDQLSIYGFVYLDYTSYQEDHELPPEGGSNKYTLETGVGKSTYLNLIGKKYQYEPITSESGNTPRRLTNILTAPDAAILQDLRLGKSPYFSSGSSPYQEAYVGFDGSALSSDPTGQLIHRENFLTDFWATKDFENNTRYLVGFNLVKFLAQKSQFPGLYTSRGAIEKLLYEGISFQFKDDSDPHIYISELKSFRVGKQFTNPVSFYNYNDLGTLSSKKPRDPNHNYPDTYLRPPRAVDFNLNVATPEATSFYFYEGTDYYEENRVSESVGEYQYFCEVAVTDVAPILLLRALKDLREAARNLRDQLNYLVDPIYGIYDPVVGKFTRSMLQVPYNDTTAHLFSKTQIETYIQYLDIFEIRINRDDGLDGHERELTRSLSHATYPDSFENAIRHIETFANDIAALANVYYTAQMGYQDEADFAKRDALVKGIYEHEFAVIDYKHSFNKTYSFGIKNNLGYSYVSLNDEDMYRPAPLKANFGLGIYSTSQYRKRILNEINKYYYQAHREGYDIGFELLPVEWNESLYKYLTPLVIKGQSGSSSKGPLKDPVVQISLPGPFNAPRAVSNILEYDVDRYASLLADLIKTKYATPYLNYVFYENHDELPNDHYNVKLYNSLLKVLGQEFSCEIALGTEPEYEVPTNKIFRDQNRASTSTPLPGEEVLSRSSIDLNIVSTPQAILGGRGDQSANTRAIIDGIQSIYQDEKNEIIDDADAKYAAGGKQSPLLPVKLVFGILGELEFNNTADLISYQQDLFNSLGRVAEILGVTEESVAADIVGRYKNIPLQVKAMLVMSLMTRRIRINAEQNLGGISVKRFNASDHDDVSESVESVKYYDNRPSIQMQNPPYKNLYDPMKTYAKFLPFWLNFKQIVRVEYLQGFGRTNAPVLQSRPFAGVVINHNSPGRPIWKELTREGYIEMTRASGGKILCRISNLVPTAMSATNEETAAGSDQGDGDEQDRPGPNNLPLTAPIELALADAYRVNEVLDLPIYHEYFFLGDEGEGQK
jgi:hypothetical protein|tara:strand:+ start:3474 stop:7334 length:3861 start_codon:yes stop_codon:yes gene_type:complete